MPLLEVGRIVKAHGIRGEVIVHLVTTREERLAPGSVLTTVDGMNLEVLASQQHKRDWIVAFSGVATRTDAEALRGVVLQAHSLDDATNSDALWVHELIGAAVVDTIGNSLGTVTSVEANPAADILVLDTGGLVPVTFVVDSEPGTVIVDPPAGLLD